MIFTHMDFRYDIACSETKSLAHTTLGLKGGSTSLFSSADQLTVLKNGCARMFPTTPNLRLGSLSNNWNNDGGNENSHFDYRNNTNTFMCCHIEIMFSLNATHSLPVWNKASQIVLYVCPDSYQFKQALGLLGDPPRVVRCVRPDGLKQLILIVALERWLANQHLVHQHTERPPVYWEGVLLS